MSTSLKATVTYEVTDNTQTTYNFPFMYLKAAFIKAAATASDGTYTTLTYSVDYTIADFNLTLASPLSVGTLLTISRETDTAQLVGWVDNSILRAYDMNKADIQTLHILEELQDYVMLHGMVLDTTDNCWEAFGKRIKHVAMPLNEDDAVTVRYIEDIKTNFISTVQKVCNDAMTALRNLCDETMAAIRNACDKALNAVGVKETDMLAELAAIRVELTNNLTQCTAKAAIATEAAKTTTAAAGRVAPVLKGGRKQCWLLCKLPKTALALVHYKILGAQYYDQYSTLEVIIKNGFGWCEYKGRSLNYQVHVKAYETENSIDVYLYAQNYDDIWEVFLVKNNAVSEFSYKYMGDETYKPEGTLKCDTVTGLGMSGVNLFCGKQIAYIESPAFTGTVSAPALTVTETLTIPGGSIWIE